LPWFNLKRANGYRRIVETLDVDSQHGVSPADLLNLFLHGQQLSYPSPRVDPAVVVDADVQSAPSRTHSSSISLWGNVLATLKSVLVEVCATVRQRWIDRAVGPKENIDRLLA